MTELGGNLRETKVMAELGGNLQETRRVKYQCPLEYWLGLSLPEQMGNIGSEISRTIKRRAAGKTAAAERSLDAALELFDMTILSCQQRQNRAGLKEVCRAREEVCDYFLGDNEYGTEPERLMRYYDGFVSLARPELWQSEDGWTSD